MKTYEREEDGNTYYLKNGELYACPTLKNGGAHWGASIPVKDFEEALENKEIERITKLLKN